MVDWQLEEQLLSWLQKLASQLRQLREQQRLSCGVKDEWELFIMLTLSDIYILKQVQTDWGYVPTTFLPIRRPYWVIRFKKYYGMPRGYSLSICARFSGQKRTSRYISGEKKAIIITSKHGTTIFFFPWKSFLWENLKKNWPKSAHKYWASISDSAHAPLVSHNTP